RCPGGNPAKRIQPILLVGGGRLVYAYYCLFFVRFCTGSVKPCSRQASQRGNRTDVGDAPVRARSRGPALVLARPTRAADRGRSATHRRRAAQRPIRQDHPGTTTGGAFSRSTERPGKPQRLAKRLKI